jgi:hypothetical protein
MRKSTVDVRRWAFDLARFDDPVVPPVPAPPPVSAPPTDPPVDPPADPPADPATGDVAKALADAEKWKALSRQNEAKAKANADAAKELADIKASQLSDTEKLTTAKEAAEKRAADAVKRAVKAEVKALAADAFADPTDAVDALAAADYVDDSGEIDIDAIKVRLGELLEAKPHWKKATAPAAPPAPRPDPSQGARPPAPPTNFKDASKEEFAAEAARLGIKPRST